MNNFLQICKFTHWSKFRHENAFAYVSTFTPYTHLYLFKLPMQILKRSDRVKEIWRKVTKAQQLIVWGAERNPGIKISLFSGSGANYSTEFCTPMAESEWTHSDILFQFIRLSRSSQHLLSCSPLSTPQRILVVVSIEYNIVFGNIFQIHFCLFLFSYTILSGGSRYFHLVGSRKTGKNVFSAIISFCSLLSV